MSGGCDRCATYGSADQRLAAARNIAAVTKERDALREQGAAARTSLAQELREALVSRRVWAGPSPSDLIGAVAGVADETAALRERVAALEGLVKAVADAQPTGTCPHGRLLDMGLCDEFGCIGLEEAIDACREAVEEKR